MTHLPAELLLVAIGVYAFGALVVGFVALERRGRRAVVVAIVVLALVAELLFYSVDSKVPVGVFRPGPLRLPEILIGAALCARVWTTGRARPMSPTGAAWLAFMIWYGTAAVAGFAYGNESSHVLFHGKVLAYVGGGYLLAGGLDPGRVVAALGRARWLAWLGPVVAVQIAANLQDRPVLGALTPAHLGPDAASMAFGFAFVVLAVAATRPRPSGLLVAAMLPLVFGVFTAGQRASFLHGVVGLSLAVLVLLSRTWRERAAVHPTQVAVGVLVLLTALGVAGVPSAGRGITSPVPVSHVISDTFGGIGKVQSTEARLDKWRVAERLLWQHPLFGSGLGVQHLSFQPGAGNGVGEVQTGSTFDNIYLDLLVRSGVVGLLLFLVAVGHSLRDAWRVWRRHTDAAVAALALGAGLFVLGMLAKGAVESVLEKVVLACSLGIALGIIAAASRDLDPPVAEAWVGLLDEGIRR